MNGERQRGIKLVGEDGRKYKLQVDVIAERERERERDPTYACEAVVLKAEKVVRDMREKWRNLLQVEMDGEEREIETDGQTEVQHEHVKIGH